VTVCGIVTGSTIFGVAPLVNAGPPIGEKEVLFLPLLPTEFELEVKRLGLTNSMLIALTGFGVYISGRIVKCEGGD